MGEWRPEGCTVACLSFPSCAVSASHSPFRSLAGISVVTSVIDIASGSSIFSSGSGVKLRARRAAAGDAPSLLLSHSVILAVGASQATLAAMQAAILLPRFASAFTVAIDASYAGVVASIALPSPSAGVTPSPSTLPVGANSPSYLGTVLGAAFGSAAAAAVATVLLARYLSAQAARRVQPVVLPPGASRYPGDASTPANKGDASTPANKLPAPAAPPVPEEPVMLQPIPAAASPASAAVVDDSASAEDAAAAAAAEKAAAEVALARAAPATFEASYRATLMSPAPVAADAVPASWPAAPYTLKLDTTRAAQEVSAVPAKLQNEAAARFEAERATEELEAAATRASLRNEMQRAAQAFDRLRAERMQGSVNDALYSALPAAMSQRAAEGGSARYPAASPSGSGAYNAATSPVAPSLSPAFAGRQGAPGVLTTSLSARYLAAGAPPGAAGGPPPVPSSPSIAAAMSPPGFLDSDSDRGSDGDGDVLRARFAGSPKRGPAATSPGAASPRREGGRSPPKGPTGPPPGPSSPLQRAAKDFLRINAAAAAAPKALSPSRRKPGVPPPFR